jgi:hypothetical protein
MASASSSQASLAESVAVRARRVRRMLSNSRPRRTRRATVTPEESELDIEFEMMSPPDGARWRGMQMYGSADGLPSPNDMRPRRGRTVLIIRLDSGNNFDLGLNAFEAVREWATRYGPVSSIQVDSRKRAAIRRKADSALRVEFRDPQTYERVSFPHSCLPAVWTCADPIPQICPDAEPRSIDMRGIGRVVLELAEQK